jgi:hypothetical protein
MEKEQKNGDEGEFVASFVEKKTMHARFLL